MTVPNGKIIEIQNEHAPQLCTVKEYSQNNHERKSNMTAPKLWKTERACNYPNKEKHVPKL